MSLNLPPTSGKTRVGLWFASTWLLSAFIPLLYKPIGRFQPGRYFLKINYFVLSAVLFMCLDKLLLIHISGQFRFF